MNWNEWQDKNLSDFDKRYAEFYAKMASAIKEKIEKDGSSQTIIADLVDMKQPAIARMLKGKSSPRLDTLMKVIYASGLDLKVIEREE